MSRSLIAYVNQRLQWTDDVTAFAAAFPSLATAHWIPQIRPQAGSPVVTLDFRSGGSPQSPALTATYDSGAKRVTFRAPTAIVALLPVGTYAFDFGFVLPLSDFRRVDGGTIDLVAGVTLAGIAGNRAPPDGADDTVTEQSTATTTTGPGSLGAYAKPAPIVLTFTAEDIIAPLSTPLANLTWAAYFNGVLYFEPAFTISSDGLSVLWDPHKAGSDASPTHINTSDPAPILLAP